MAESKGTSPWVWVGCGCVAAVFLVIAAIAAAGFLGARAVKGYVEDMENPESRRARALEILGTDQLPEGLNTQMFFSVPFVMDVVLLSDAPPNEGQDMQTEDLGERALFFLSMRNLGDASQDLEKILEGDSSQLNLDVDMDFRSQGELGRGEFEQDAQRVRWAAHLGSAQGAMNRQGVFTVFLVDCIPSDEKIRMAYYWDQIETDAETTSAAAAEATAAEATAAEASAAASGAELTPENVEIAGTPADEQVLRDLLGHFSLCAGSGS